MSDKLLVELKVYFTAEKNLGNSPKLISVPHCLFESLKGGLQAILHGSHGRRSRRPNTTLRFLTSRPSHKALSDLENSLTAILDFSSDDGSEN